MKRQKIVTEGITNMVKWFPARYPVRWALSPDDVPPWDGSRQQLSRPHYFSGTAFGNESAWFSPESSPFLQHRYLASADAPTLSPYDFLVLVGDKFGEKIFKSKFTTPQWPEALPAPEEGYPRLVRAVPNFTPEYEAINTTPVPDEPVTQVLAKLFVLTKDSYPSCPDSRVCRHIVELAQEYGNIAPSNRNSNTLGLWLEMAFHAYFYLRLKAMLDNSSVTESEDFCAELEGELAAHFEKLKGSNPTSLWWSSLAVQELERLSMLLREQRVKTRRQTREVLRRHLLSEFGRYIHNNVVFSVHHGCFFALVGIGGWQFYELAEVMASTDTLKPCENCQTLFTSKSSKRRFCSDACKQAAYRDRTQKP
jgi:hypothetical protein